MKISLVVKFLACRFLFAIHAVLSVYLLYANTKDWRYWSLMVPVLFLIIETLYMFTIRKVKEFRYFWPSGFFYILTLLPIIWVIELELLSARIEKNQLLQNGNNKDRVKISSGLGLGISFEAVGKLVCEVGIMIVLIFGRWLMPRGSLSRDQLSALLLGYVGNAADILELFETFGEPDVAYERPVTLAVIAVYSWSVFQFTLVTTATIKDKKELDEDIERKTLKNNKVAPTKPKKMSKNTYINDIQQTTGKRLRKTSRGRGRKPTNLSKGQDAINVESAVQYDERIRRRALHGEVFQILVTLIMQDGPFLILRLYLFVVFNVVSEMHIFFTCKNAIVSILLVYRLCILTCRGEDREIDFYQEDATSRLHNVQLAMVSTRLEKHQTGSFRVK